MKSSLFKRVVVPAMGVEGTTVLAISTPDDEFNYFSELTEMKRADGTSLFYLIMVGLACQSCMDSGIGHECMHMLAEQPPWKSVARNEQMKRILASDTAAHMRENLGMIVGSDRYIYHRDWIKAFMQRTPYKIRVNPEVIFTTVDPHGGGTMSDCAAMTCCYPEGKIVIVAGDRSGSSEDRVIMDLTLNHIRRVRAVSTFKKSLIILNFEANMGWDRGDRLNLLLSADEFQPLRFLQHRPKDNPKTLKYGVFTTPKLKVDGAMQLEDALLNGHLCYSADFVSENVDVTRRSLTEQLTSYRHQIEEPVDQMFGKFKEAFGGKGPGGKKDDLVMVLQQNIRTANQLRKDPSFMQNMTQSGYRLSN